MNAVKERLERAGLRVELDDRNEKIGFKIREAQLAKIPYMLVAGDKEAESGTLSVRKRGGVDLGTQSLDDFLSFILKEVAKKTIS
jgi:threonyl-tRNA synthetase